jgi:hypothetical protein
VITNKIIESYRKCNYKTHLFFQGKSGKKSLYENYELEIREKNKQVLGILESRFSDNEKYNIAVDQIQSNETHINLTFISGKEKITRGDKIEIATIANIYEKITQKIVDKITLVYGTTLGKTQFSLKTYLKEASKYLKEIWKRTLLKK